MWRWLAPNFISAASRRSRAGKMDIIMSVFPGLTTQRWLAQAVDIMVLTSPPRKPLIITGPQQQARDAIQEQNQQDGHDNVNTAYASRQIAVMRQELRRWRFTAWRMSSRSECYQGCIG